MFGLTTPGRDWTSTVPVEDRPCQLCHALEADYGRIARALTNHDAGFLLWLLEAQTKTTTTHLPSSLHCGGTVCSVYRPSSAPACSRYAAAVLVLWFGIKLQDDVRDESRVLARLLWHSCRRHIERARGVMRELGLDPAALDEQVSRQIAVEAAETPSLQALCDPTATAVAAVFAHTACLADRPGNTEQLLHLGDRFGRLVYLTDAYADWDRDRRGRRFNALRVAYPEVSHCQRRQIPSSLRRRWFELSYGWSQDILDDLRRLELTQRPYLLERAIAVHLRGNLSRLYRMSM